MYRNTRKLLASATALAALALGAAQLGSAAPAHPGKKACTLSAKGHVPLGRLGDPNPGQVWKNTGRTCHEDGVQTIYANHTNKWTAVSIDVVNSGDCSLQIGWAPQEGDFSQGNDWQLPTGTHPNEPFPVAPGGFLLATCLDVNHNGKCKWRISDLKVRT